MVHDNVLSDYGTLHKVDLKCDIIKKKREIERLQAHTDRLKSAIERLHRDFNVSRNYGIIHRYGLLKEMVLRTIGEMRQCHNPQYELQWVENDRRSGITCEQTFFYLRSASF